MIPNLALEAAEQAVIDAMIKHGPDGHIDGYQMIARAALEAAVPILREDDKASAELAKALRAVETYGQVIEKQCRDILDVTGLHHLINEDGDGHWDVVWMRLFEMRDELADLKESTLWRERKRGDSWRDRAQETEARAQTLEMELRAATERAEVAEAAVQRVRYLLDATDPDRYAMLSMEGLRLGIRSALEGGGAA